MFSWYQLLSRVLLINNLCRNDWGDCTDRFPGHPLGVSSLAKAGNNTLYTGSGDGIIRVIGILPNTLLGTIGGNEDESPIESMKLSHDGKW